MLNIRVLLLLIVLPLTWSCVEKDVDGDGVADRVDNCVNDFNRNQADADGDGVGDVCDPDADGDGVANIADFCWGDNASGDDDEDWVCDDQDNCDTDRNTLQDDADNDGDGDECDATSGAPLDNSVAEIFAGDFSRATQFQQYGFCLQLLQGIFVSGNEEESRLRASANAGELPQQIVDARAQGSVSDELARAIRGGYLKWLSRIWHPDTCTTYQPNAKPNDCTEIFRVVDECRKQQIIEKVININ